MSLPKDFNRKVVRLGFEADYKVEGVLGKGTYSKVSVMI